MRVRDGEGDFSEWLLKLCSGTIPVKEEDPFKGCIEIPQQCIIRENESIVEKIFGDAQQDDYAKRVTLTPTNVDSLSINEEVLERIHGEVKTYLNANQIGTDNLNEINNFPVEFLNSLTPSEIFDLKAGLCNGTRMKVCALQNNYIDAEVLTGVSEGKRIFVPRIQLAPSVSNLPFVLKRRVFPVRLAYSMTINKSQGQTFDRVGYFEKDFIAAFSINVYINCNIKRLQKQKARIEALHYNLKKARIEALHYKKMLNIIKTEYEECLKCTKSTLAYRLKYVGFPPNYVINLYVKLD
nr:uncharacterized protein LOC124814457 [Hydra vulgaris]